MRFKNNNHIAYLATLAAFLLMMQVGIEMGWVSPNIVYLKSAKSDIPIDDNQASWLASIVSLFSFLTAFINMLISEPLGSRTTMIIAFTFVCISWICMILANSVTWLFIALALCGITRILTYSSFSLYLGEVVEPRIRGTLIAIAATGNPFGVVVGSIAETYLPRKISSSIYLASSLLGLILILWLRNSPYFLMKKGDIKGVKKSIAFYHSENDQEEKLLEIQNFMQTRKSYSFRDKVRDLNRPLTRKSIIISFSCYVLTHLSGNMAITSYMEVILKKSKSKMIKPEQLVIYANTTSLVAHILTFPLIDKLGRRYLYIMSSIGATIAMTGLGTHFFLLQQGVHINNFQWLPCVCILGYLISFAIGFAPVPSTVLSELFTGNIKTTAASIVVLFVPLASFIVTKSYQPLVNWIGETYVFWMYAVLSFVSTPYALFILPETKGKTFQEIQNMLQTKKY